MSNILMKLPYHNSQLQSYLHLIFHYCLVFWLLPFELFHILWCHNDDAVSVFMIIIQRNTVSLLLNVWETKYLLWSMLECCRLEWSDLKAFSRLSAVKKKVGNNLINIIHIWILSKLVFQLANLKLESQSYRICVHGWGFKFSTFS